MGFEEQERSNKVKSRDSSKDSTKAQKGILPKGVSPHVSQLDLRQKYEEEQAHAKIKQRKAKKSEVMRKNQEKEDYEREQAILSEKYKQQLEKKKQQSGNISRN